VELPYGRKCLEFKHLDFIAWGETGSSRERLGFGAVDVLQE
jgi:hypothetical protein